MLYLLLAPSEAYSEISAWGVNRVAVGRETLATRWGWPWGGVTLPTEEGGVVSLLQVFKILSLEILHRGGGNEERRGFPSPTD